MLTDIGREQAKLAGSALRNIEFDACISSPLARANEFAQIAWAHAGKRQNLREGDAHVQRSDNLKEAHLPLLGALVLYAALPSTGVNV